MLAAIAMIFASCSKEDNPTPKPLSEQIIGKWMTTEIIGGILPTNEKYVINFATPTKVYVSTSRSDYTEQQKRWTDHQEFNYSIDGNTISFAKEISSGTSLVTIEVVIKSITDKELACVVKRHIRREGQEPTVLEYSAIYNRVTKDYSKDVLGLWEGHCTSAGSVFDDGQEHRWQYKADGTYVYYVKDGDDWVPSENTLNEYFVDGTLLCSRWIDQGQENREWWEINIDGDKMNWTALRQKEDGSTFTATFEMKKVE